MPGTLKPKTAQLCHQISDCRQSIIVGLEATRISNILFWHFEQVAFPGEYPLFEVSSGAELELLKLGDHSHP